MLSVKHAAEIQVFKTDLQRLKSKMSAARAFTLANKLHIYNSNVTYLKHFRSIIEVSSARNVLRSSNMKS